MNAAQRLFRLWIVEASKWKRHPYLWVASLGCVGVVLLLGVTQKTVVGGSGFECYKTCFTYGLFAGTIAILVFAATQVAGERQLRTLNMFLVNPVRRVEVVYAKVLMVTLFASFILLLVSASSLLVSQLLFRIADVKRVESLPVLTADQGYNEIINVALYVWAPLVATGISGVLVSTFFDRNRIAVAWTLTLHALMAAVAVVTREHRSFSDWLLYSWIDLSLVRLEEVFRPGAPDLPELVDAGLVPTTIIALDQLLMTSLLYAVGATLAAAMIFRSRDIKI